MKIIEQRTCLECNDVLNAWKTYVMVKKVMQREFPRWRAYEARFYVHTSCLQSYRMKKEVA